MKKNPIRLLVISAVLIVVITSLISAFDFDNVKHFDRSKGNFGEITIVNAFGLGEDLATYKLNEVSNSVINAYAKGTATLYQEGKLFTGKEFKDFAGRNINLAYSQLYILVEEEYIELQPIYEQTCEKTIDEFGKFYDKCTSTLKETLKNTRTRNVWKEYNYETLKTGNYEWKIEVKRPANLKTDFVLITGFGDHKTIEWAWWNNSWLNKKNMTIQENQGMNYTNYTILYNVAYETGMQTDFDDLRFLDSNEGSELNYWIENYTASTNAWVWIKVPYLNATLNTTIWMYYGNSLVENLSNQYSAFLFYDDFESNYTYNWTVIQGGGNNIYLQNSAGVQRLVIGTGAAGIKSVITNKNITDDTGGMWEVKSRVVMASEGIVGASNTWGVDEDYDSTGGSNKNATFGVYIAGAGGNRLYNYIKGSETHSTADGYAPDDYRIFEIIKNGSTASYLYINYTLMDAPLATPPTNPMGGVLVSRGSSYIAVDWFMIKRFAFVEPTVTLGAKQSISSSVDTTLLSPANGQNTSLVTQVFNATCSPISANLTNATLNIWNSLGSLYESLFNSLSGNISVNTSFTSNSLVSGNYTWNVKCEGVKADDSTTFYVTWGTANFSIQSNYSEWFTSTLSYNATTYDTILEYLSVNITYNSSLYPTTYATLNYNGTAYTTTKAGTGDNVRYYNDLTMGSPFGTKTFYWNFTFVNTTGGYYRVNSSTGTQTVSAINFTICVPSPENVTFINFTFKDETTNAYIDAATDLVTWNYTLGSGSYSYLFTNVSSNPSYAFCFFPPDKTITYSVTYQYSNTSYPQRIWTNTGTLTNTTTNQILYLLGTADGIYSSYQITTSSGQVISGATIKVERQFSGVWAIVGQATTDSSGLATFFLNPNYDHRITVSKTGYITSVNTIRPTQSIYTIILSSTTPSGVYNNSLEGITWIRGPPVGLLVNGLYNFYFNVSATKSNLRQCRMELLNSTGTIVASTNGTGTSTCNIKINYQFKENQLFGRYYVDLGGGYILIESDGNWKNVTIKETGNTIKDFLDWIGNTDNWMSTPGGGYDTDEYKRFEYTKIVAFFLIFAILIAGANVATSFDIIQPGIFVFGFPLVILFFSVSGFFTIHGATPLVLLDKYLIALYSGIFSAGFYFATLRREG